MAEAGAAVLQPRSVELALAHGVDIHLRSSFSTEAGTWIRREAAGLRATGSTDVAGVAHRRQESLYAVDGVGAGAVTAALAERGIAHRGGAARGHRGPVHRARRRAAEVTAALDAVGCRGHGRPGAGVGVSVVSLGIARKPEIPMRALAALEAAGIAPQLVTTTAGPGDRPRRRRPQVDDAVRLLHGDLHPGAEQRPTRPAGGRGAA